MPKIPAIHLYPGDWLRDEIAGCSLGAQGLWLRMMFIMHDSDRYGYLSKNGVPMHPGTVAQRCGCTPDQYTTLLCELDANGIPSRLPDGTIFSRRMVRDEKIRQESRRNGRKGGNPLLKDESGDGVNPPVNPTLKVKRKKKKGDSGLGVQGEGVEFYDLFPEGLKVPKFIEAWNSWISHRKQKGGKYTMEAAKKALPMLGEEGVDAAIARIDRSIMNCWAGLFFPGEKNGNGNHGKQSTRDSRTIPERLKL